MVILNTTNPNSDDANRLRMAMQDKYGVSVMLLDIMRLDENDINMMLQSMLYEFPLRQVHIDFPTWAQALDDDHWLIQQMMSDVKCGMDGLSKVKDYNDLLNAFENSDYVKEKATQDVAAGAGQGRYQAHVQRWAVL